MTERLWHFMKVMKKVSSDWLEVRIALRAVWRSSMMECGGLCAMTTGTLMMPMLCVSSFITLVQKKHQDLQLLAKVIQPRLKCDALLLHFTQTNSWILLSADLFSFVFFNIFYKCFVRKWKNLDGWRSLYWKRDHSASVYLCWMGSPQLWPFWGCRR